MSSDKQQHDPTGAPRRSWHRILAALLVVVSLGGALALLVSWHAAGQVGAPPNIPPSVLPKLNAEARSLRDEAFAAAERLVEKYPRDPDAHYSKAAVHKRFGDTSVALAAWRECLKLDPNFALAYYCLGWNALDQQEHDQSIDFLQKAVKLDPAIGHAYLLLAQALMNSGRTAEAERPLQTHLRLVPRSAEGHCRLGQIYLHSNDYQRAQRYFLAALEIHPASRAARDGLATALEGLGESEQAEKYRDDRPSSEVAADQLDPQVEEVSGNAESDDTRSSAAFALTDVGKVYGAHGDLPEALDHWQRAANIDSRDTECRQWLVSVYQQSKHFEKALRFLEELGAIEPGNPIHQINIGVLASQIGRFEAAETAFRRVQQLIPDRYEGYAGLAKLYLDGDRNTAESMSLAQKAVELAPIAGNFYLLGIAQLKSGDLQDSLTSLEQAGQLERGNPIFQQALEEVRARIARQEDSP